LSTNIIISKFLFHLKRYIK